MSKCRACKAEIMFIEMASGKKMPVDAKPLIVVQVKDGIGKVIEAYYPHWATCPGAHAFRKKGK